MIAFGRLLVIIGLTIAVSGIAILTAVKLFPGINQMPGTFSFEGQNFRVYFPLGLMILLSVVGTILLNVIIRMYTDPQKLDHKLRWIQV